MISFVSSSPSSTSSTSFAALPFANPGTLSLSLVLLSHFLFLNSRILPYLLLFFVLLLLRNAVIRKSELLQVLYFKLRRDSGESTSSGQRKSMEFGLQEVAMKYHRLCLQRGRIDIHQWKAHSVG